MKNWRSMRRDPDMASCKEAARVLQSYLDREVDEHTARRVARHLEMCRRCGLEAATYTEIKSALSRRARIVDASALERLQAFGEDLASGIPPAQAGGAPPNG